MAWSLVGVGGSNIVASGNVTLSEPAGCQEGDLLIACIAYRSNAAFSMPSGWTQIEVQNTGDIDATNGIASGVMAYIVRGASAPAGTFTRTGGDLGLGRIIAYRGNAASPLGAHSSNTVSLAATATTPSITTSAANSLIVAMCAAGDNLSHTAFDAATDPATASAATSDTTTAPTAGTWIERSDLGTATGADGALAIADAIRATAGATGQIQCTVSSTGGHVLIAAEFLIGAEPISGSLSATLGEATAAGTGSLSINGSTSASLGEATLAGTGSLSIAGSASATLGEATLSATGSLSIAGTLNATLGEATLAGVGSSDNEISGSLAATLGEMTAAGTGSLSLNGALAASLGALTSAGTGSLSLNASIATTLGAATLAGTGSLANRGSLAATLGAMVANATGDYGEAGSGNGDHTVVNYGWRDRHWPGNGRGKTGAGLWRKN